jgi:hypothetical protein
LSVGFGWFSGRMAESGSSDYSKDYSLKSEVNFAEALDPYAKGLKGARDH